jgi:hypothetical protein
LSFVWSIKNAFSILLEYERGIRLKALLVSAAILPLLAIPVSTVACSAVGCRDRGVELRRNFTVTVTHEDKPLPGVSVRITGNSEAAGHQSFSGLTSADGTAYFVNLPPGDYWIEADLLGIEAGYECFHINSPASRKARKIRRYEWGDMALATRQAVGRLVESQPGKGGNPLENLLHRVDVPIPQARLELRQPVIGTVYRTVSDANGHFAFGRVRDGIYVLHVEEAGAAPGDSTDLLLRFSNTANGRTLLLSRREAGGGRCGGTSLTLEEARNQ